MAGSINKNKIIAAAQKFVQKGQYDRAIREYSKIVEEDPRDVRIWLKIGDLYAKKSSKQEAVDTYIKVAEFYSEQGFYLKAVAVYKQILKLNPALVDVNLKLAELYKQLGLLNDAMHQYEVVSNYFHQTGRTKDALAALRQIVDLDPENVASRIKLAELYSKEQMRPEAVEEFSKAADYLRASNRVEDFIKVAERLVFHQPDNLAVTKELASLYLQRQDPRRALQKLQLAFKADPRDEDTLSMLAQAFQDLGQVAKTVPVLKELAQIQADGGQHEERLKTLRRILVLAPDDAEALQALGQASAGAPARPAAPAPKPQSEAAAPKAAAPSRAPAYPPERLEAYDDEPAAVPPLELPYPDDLPAEYLPPLDVGVPPPPTFKGGAEDLGEETARVLTEAEVYIKYGLHEKAIDHLRQVFGRDPHNVPVRLKLRDLYLQIGRYADASRELYTLAQRMAASEAKAAAQYLNEALELDPGNHAARQLLNQLEAGRARPGAGPSASAASQPEYLDEGFAEESFSGSGYRETAPIDLDTDDIVEEIPIEAVDLLEVEGSSRVTDYVHDTATMSPARRRGRSSRPVRPLEPSGSGVIELRGETTDTLGGGTPSSEVIALPADSRPSDSQLRIGEEETSGEGLEDDLEEADFFILQNLFGEARTILDELRSRYPRHPLVAAKLADLAKLEQRALSTPGLLETEDTTSDLADELAAELDDDVQLPVELSENYSVEDVFDEFKRGGEAQVSDEDSDTHYDLGIAYREMGLLDDAVAEFKVAMRSREKEVLCHMMIGLCLVEKGMVSEAINQFKSGLYVNGITDRETIALYFELGQAYENLQDLREALYYYEKVGKKDPRFRDVAGRIQRLRRLAGRSDDGSPSNSGGGGTNSGDGPTLSENTDALKLV
ncbi:MAG: tetratricopeptide repeat protein [Deltaproteobacteria bacterium]|nr:tetratricopeptide repeat protein [Deltaproteobacteria bacterium]